MENLKTACAQKEYNIIQSDLPLSCPMRGSNVYSAHPKVYLKLDKDGKAQCPYCSALYKLTGNK